MEMSLENTTFPLEIKDVDQKLNNEIMSHFTGELTGFIQIGPKKYYMPHKYKEMAAQIYNMPLRESDIFIVTNPRSGTTWAQEMIWLINNDLDYSKAATVPLVRRFPYLEGPAMFNDKLADEYREKQKGKHVVNVINTMTSTSIEYLKEVPSPRYIKSHLPLSLLPPALLDTCRAVYVARDPRDAAVSFYHHNRLINMQGFNGDFKTYWKYFYNNLVLYSPFLENIKEAWPKRNHPNLLFLFYEDMVKDLPAAVKKMSDFFGKHYTEEQMSKLVEHLTFDNFKNNTSVNLQSLDVLGFTKKDEQSFIRKGKVGDWRNYFDKEMTVQAQQWMADSLKDTDFRFPHLDGVEGFEKKECNKNKL